MGKIYDQLDDRLVDFIGRQHVFFVGTAPDSPEGHLNVSPKGLDTFRILGPTDGGLPRPHRQRDRDGRPPPGERSDHHHVLRLRGHAR